MGVANKIFAVLALFDAQHPVWRMEDLAQQLGLSRATAYRYTKELLDSGLLHKHPTQGLTLGFRALQLGHCVQQTDPLLCAAGPVLRTLVRHTQHAAVVSVLMPHGEIVDVLQCDADSAQPWAPGSSRALPQAGAALLQLAFCPPAQQAALVRPHLQPQHPLRHWHTWAACAQELQRLKACRFLTTTHERGAHLVDAAVPIFSPDGIALATLNLVHRAEDATGLATEAIQHRLAQAAWDIRTHLATSAPSAPAAVD